MCKLIISIVLIMTTFGSYAQAIIGKMYTIVPDFVNVYGVTKTNSIDPVAKFRASGGTKFTVTGFDKDHNIKLTFWRYVDARMHTKQYDSVKRAEELYNFGVPNGYIGKWANYKEFAMSPEDFNSSCIAYYGTKTEFTWGVMTLPIKLRPGNGSSRFFSYEESLNLGFVFGWRQQLKGKVKHSINYLMGVGIANVKTDSLSQKSGISPAGASAAAFSVNAGVLYAHNNFQIGFFVGKDHIPGSQGRDWKYQGKPWIGLAVGISLFSDTDSQGGAGTNTDKEKDK
ncbi:hypothetical protein A0256_08880 [Mucilaginibacter sp. PAMC 26640]|nr:hypothetical protein A0256_08880 [Mucilaginibacter sp. PAMC 26640]